MNRSLPNCFVCLFFVNELVQTSDEKSLWKMHFFCAEIPVELPAEMAVVQIWVLDQCVLNSS